MKMIEALKMVLELAEGNMLSKDEANGDHDLEVEYQRQHDARDQIEQIVEAVETGEIGQLGASRFWLDDK